MDERGLDHTCVLYAGRNNDTYDLCESNNHCYKTHTDQCDGFVLTVRIAQILMKSMYPALKNTLLQHHAQVAMTTPQHNQRTTQLLGKTLH